MPHIRSNGKDFVLLAIQRVRVEAQLVVPKSRVETLEQRSSFCPQLSCAIALAQCIKNLSHTDPGIVDITLKLAQRLRSFDQRTIGVDDGVAGILPSHIFITDRRACLVFLEAVTVTVSIFVDPRQAAFCRLKMPLQ